MKRIFLILLLFSNLAYTEQGSFSSSDLIMLLHMNEGTGDVTYDGSVNGNNGILVGGLDAAGWVGGNFAKGLQFDGLDDKVQCGNKASFNTTDAITVTAWIKPASFAGYYARIVEKAYNTSWFFGQGDSGYNLDVYINGTDVNHTVGVLLTLNIWNLVGFTYDRKNVSVFHNGKLIKTSPYTNAIGVDTKIVTIGCNSTATTNLFAGVIDEVSISSRAFTQGEMQELYNETRGQYGE